MVLVGTGGVDHASLVQLAEKHFSSLPVTPKPTVLGRALYPKTDFVGAEARIRDDTIPSVNFALAVEGMGGARQTTPPDTRAPVRGRPLGPLTRRVPTPLLACEPYHLREQPRKLVHE